MPSGRDVDPDEPRNEAGEWTSSGFTFSNKPGKELPTKPDAYHGSGQPWQSDKTAEVYLANDPREAVPFAEGAHLGGSGNDPQIHGFYLKPGKVCKIDDEIYRAMDEGDFGPETIDKIIAEERGKTNGARYLSFTHPGLDDNIPVLAALHPEDDLEHAATAKLGDKKALAAMLRGSHVIHKLAKTHDR